MGKPAAMEISGYQQRGNSENERERVIPVATSIGQLEKRSDKLLAQLLLAICVNDKRRRLCDRCLFRHAWIISAATITVSQDAVTIAC